MHLGEYCLSNHVQAHDIGLTVCSSVDVPVSCNSVPHETISLSFSCRLIRLNILFGSRVGLPMAFFPLPVPLFWNPVAVSFVTARSSGFELGRR